MTTPTFNRFKSTTIYGSFNNVDYPDNSLLASAYFQRNLTISGDLTCSGIIYGKKLFYNNVDISSTFVSNITLSSTLSNYALSSALSNYALSSAFSNYALSSSLNNYALLSGTTFTGNVSGLTAATSDNTTKFATTAFVKAQNYLTTASLSPYALLSGTTFTGNVSGLTAATSDNTTKFATTAFVKAQNYLTTASLSPYALLSGTTFTGDVSVPNKLSVRQTSPTSPAVLEFATDTGDPRAYIYASFISNVFRFDILPSCPNGFEWSSSGDSLMQLDMNGNLTINGSLGSSITTVQNPLPSPAPIVMTSPTGRYETDVTSGLTNTTITQNGVSIIIIGLTGGTQSTTPIQFSNIRYIPNGTSTGQNTNIIIIAPFYGTVYTTPVVFVNANVYDTNNTTGVPIRGYVTLYKNHNSNPTPYHIVFVSYTTLSYNSNYTMDPFQFTYMYN